MSPRPLSAQQDASFCAIVPGQPRSQQNGSQLPESRRGTSSDHVLEMKCFRCEHAGGRNRSRCDDQ